MNAPSLSSGDFRSFSDVRNEYHRITNKRQKRHRRNVFICVVLIAIIASLLFIIWPHQTHISTIATSADPMTVDLVMMPENVSQPSPQHQSDTQNLPETPVKPEEIVPEYKVPTTPTEKPEIFLKKETKKVHPKKRLPLKKPAKQDHQDKSVKEKTTAAQSAASSIPAPQTPSLIKNSATQTFQNRQTWQSALLAQLEKYKRYPAAAMADHQEGLPLIRFSIDREGKVLNVKLVKSSDFPLLDEEALALPKRAQPLPPPPETIKGAVITLTVPVEFTVHRD